MTIPCMTKYWINLLGKAQKLGNPFQVKPAWSVGGITHVAYILLQFLSLVRNMNFILIVGTPSEKRRKDSLNCGDSIVTSIFLNNS